MTFTCTLAPFPLLLIVVSTWFVGISSLKWKHNMLLRWKINSNIERRYRVNRDQIFASNYFVQCPNSIFESRSHRFKKRFHMFDSIVLLKNIIQRAVVITSLFTHMWNSRAFDFIEVYTFCKKKIQKIIMYACKRTSWLWICARCDHETFKQ